MLIGIIEDDKLLNQALNIAFSKAGYRVHCYTSVKEAVEGIKRNENLLIIDIGLPDGDGISLYRNLCKNRRIPAVFLTARDEEREMLAAFSS